MHMRNEQDMNSKQRDPLGLAALPPLEPDFDGWPEIRQALESSDVHRPHWRQTVTWLAAAASVVLAVALFIRQGAMAPTGQPTPAQTAQTTEADPLATVDSLIAMSQTLERQVVALSESGNLREEFNEKADLVRTALATDVDWGIILNDLARLLPPRLWVETFSGAIVPPTTPGVVGQVAFSGIGFDFPDVSAWLRALGSGRCACSTTAVAAPSRGSCAASTT